MLAVGVALLVITGIAPKVSTSVRTQEQAFNAAEAGFEAARITLENNLLSGTWNSLTGNCLRTPTGIDTPILSGSPNSGYFRRLSDVSLIQTLSAGTTGVIYYNQPFIQTGSGTYDTTRTYTVFLIDQGLTSDALMVCIGIVWAGKQVLASSRLEIDIGLQSSGTTP
jgi:Tfp pilus assembly protein PilX